MGEGDNWKSTVETALMCSLKNVSKPAFKKNEIIFHRNRSNTSSLASLNFSSTGVVSIVSQKEKELGSEDSPCLVRRFKQKMADKADSDHPPHYLGCNSMKRSVCWNMAKQAVGPVKSGSPTWRDVICESWCKTWKPLKEKDVEEEKSLIKLWHREKQDELAWIIQQVYWRIRNIFTY